LQCSQQRAAGPCSEQDESSPYPSMPLLSYPFLIFFPSMPTSYKYYFPFKLSDENFVDIFILHDAWEFDMGLSHSDTYVCFVCNISIPLYFTPCSGVNFWKLIVAELIKKFYTFYGTPKLITVFTGVLHLFLFNPVQAPTSFLRIHFNIILPLCLCLPSGLFTRIFLQKYCR